MVPRTLQPQQHFTSSKVKNVESISVCSGQYKNSALTLKLNFWIRNLGCTVVWWLAPSPHSKRVPSSIPTWGLSVWSLHALPVYAWVLSGYSGFLPPSKNMHVRLIGDTKLSLGVSVSMCGCCIGCLSCLSLCGPVMDWRPVQGIPRLSPDDRWDSLQPPRDSTDGLSGYRKWMDGLECTIPHKQVLPHSQPDPDVWT